VILNNHIKILSNSVIEHDDIIHNFVTIASSVSLSGNVERKEGVYLGSNSSIKENVIIGEWSIIGMDAVVLDDVPPYSIEVGNPGKIIKTNKISLSEVEDNDLENKVSK
jgi:acetyltransferase EpsM